MAAMGTLAWGERRQGRLTMLERWTFALQGVRAVLANSRAARAPEPPALDIDAKRPKSVEARRAEGLLEETSPPWLMHHGFRTYAWALALAARDGLRPDREVLYCASLLHDLGITERFLAAPGECFALKGARSAKDALVAAGMLTPLADRVAEAIALHLNLVVALRSHGAEAHLLRAATALDVIGQNLRHIPTLFREQTLRDIPRLDFKQGVVTAMAKQSEQSPKTRIGVLCRRLNLLDRARRAPFAS
jgi:HD superfamily phosphodiesterase